MNSSINSLLSTKKCLIIGSNGQVGRALKELFFRQTLSNAVFWDRRDCDLENADELAEMIVAIKPQVIINASAYTKVDQAEKESDHAFAINEKAVAVMARYISQKEGGVLLHYSTDYVFADTKTTAYLETDTVGPVDQLCIYGQSKLAGELAIREAFDLNSYSASGDFSDSLDDLNVFDADLQSSAPRYFILRTSWVFGDGDNFIRTMLRLAGERDQLKVVADQVGAPTSARWLAEVGVQMAGSSVESGIYHAVPDGEVSWHGLAVFAIETAASYGEGIEVKSENILPIPATEYPVPAARPYNSRLSNQKLKKALSEMAFTGQYPHWRDQVDQYVKEYVKRSLRS
jgi:dTDP-4-dehydrorhamnose reductase